MAQKGLKKQQIAPLVSRNACSMMTAMKNQISHTFGTVAIGVPIIYKIEMPLNWAAMYIICAEFEKKKQED